MRLTTIVLLAVITLSAGAAVAREDSDMTTGELMEKPADTHPAKLIPGPPPKVNPAKKLPKMDAAHLLAVKPAKEVPKMDSMHPPVVKPVEKEPKTAQALPEDPTAKRNREIMEKMKAANKTTPNEYKETEAYKNASSGSQKDIDRKVERARILTERYDSQHISREE